MSSDEKMTDMEVSYQIKSVVNKLGTGNKLVIIATGHSVSLKQQAAATAGKVSNLESSAFPYVVPQDQTTPSTFSLWSNALDEQYTFSCWLSSDSEGNADGIDYLLFSMDGSAPSASEAKSLSGWSAGTHSYSLQFYFSTDGNILQVGTVDVDPS